MENQRAENLHGEEVNNVGLVGNGMTLLSFLYTCITRFWTCSSNVSYLLGTACGQKCVIMAAAQTLDSFFAS